MKELFYFSKSDLMVQVQLSQQSKSVRYSSHRKINDGEKELVERYIMENIANKNKNSEYRDATLDYAGVDYKLIHHLNQFNSVKSLKKDNEQSSFGGESNPFSNIVRKDIDQSVQHLIKISMEKYYFEKIGSVIVEGRKAAEEGAREEEIRSYRNNLEELVVAYNHYSPTGVDLNEVLPKELDIK